MDINSIEMMNNKNFNLILVDIQVNLCEAWIKEFENFNLVSIHHGIFQDVRVFDCLVSPANSYGMMDGGIDLAIRNYFGLNLQDKIQDLIKESYYGEQPVGTSVIIETGNLRHPFLAHTPTMRVPMDISNTDNVYNATFAMLRAVANHNKNSEVKIQHVLCPGLGTATGRVSSIDAARQMALAYNHFIEEPQSLIWSQLMERNKKILNR